MTDSAAPNTPMMQPGADGLPVAIPQKAMLERLFSDVVRKALGERRANKSLTYENLIIDEASTFWTRMFEEIQPFCVNKEGKPDPLKAYVVGAAWSRAVIDLLRQIIITGMNLCIVAHNREPDQVAEKKGGPKFFSQEVMTQLCADADGVLLREVRDVAVAFDMAADAATIAQAMAAAKDKPSERLWRAHASEHWLSKLRGLPDSKFSEIRKMEAENILRMAGYTP